MTRSLTPSLLVLLAGGILAPLAHAQVLMPETTRWSLPDFDQRRSGLANSGNNHCVPTSHANMLAYINDHGFPLVFPNVLNSASPGEYQDITNNIMSLGAQMGTTGSGGTSGQGCINGMSSWLGGLQILFNVSYLNGPSITPSTIYFNTLGNGLVAVCYGRWEYISANGRYERTGGGHCITVRGMKDVYFPMQGSTRPLLKYRDPASDDGNLFAQTPYATSNLRLRPFTANFKGYGTVTMWELITPDTSDQYHRCLDGFTAIHPIFALQPDSTGNALKLKTVIQLPDSPAEGTLPLTGVTDFAFGNNPQSVFGIGAFNSDFSRLILGNPLAGGISHQVLVPGTGGRVAPGPDGEVFVISGSSLRSMKPADDGSMLPLATPVTLPVAVDDILFDDVRGGPTLLMGDGSVREYNRGLTGLVTKTLATPPGWPASTGPTHRRMRPGATSAAGSDYLFGPLTGGLIKRYSPDPSVPTRLVLAETITPPAGTPFTDFDVNDLGELILNRGGVVQVLKKNIGGAGGWIIDTGNPFNGMTLPGGGARLHLSRSRSNYDPAIQDFPEWKTDVANPAPIATEVPDCFADVGRTGGVAEPDGALDNNDFIVYIDWFFAFDGRADIGSVGGVAGADGAFNNNDFVVYIDRFFTPCQ